ncbi:hypothetical protein [Dactylosporangium sp. CS-033363]|uniref:hypothetical protein n=1 Tax=Dactylosporangium sp. CS-033363 TaxID=3239935 RepID=UPI003D941802
MSVRTEDPDQLADMARKLVTAAAALSEAREAMSEAGFAVDGHPDEVLAETASALRGAAMRAAMAIPGSRATELLNEFTPRRDGVWRELTSTDTTRPRQEP